MKSIRMPTFASFFGPQPKAPGRHRAGGRARRPKYVPQHAKDSRTIPPGSQAGGPGRHRRADPPPPGRRAKVGQHAAMKPGRRVTPLDDR